MSGGIRTGTLAMDYEEGKKVIVRMLLSHLGRKAPSAWFSLVSIGHEQVTVS